VLQRISLILLVALTSSCKSGPDLTYWTIQPGPPGGQHGAQGASEKKDLGWAPLSQLDNYPCVSPRDRAKILEACKLNLKGKTSRGAAVTYCVIDCKDPAKRCEGQCSDGENGVSWPIVLMNNYTCLSPRENADLLKYCKISAR
jgi:hypothetical protein